MMHKQAIDRLKRRKEIEEYGKFLIFNEHFSVHCKRCGRNLKSKFSIKRGYGYKCWKKIQLTQERFCRNWTSKTREKAFKTAYELLQVELQES